MKPERLVSDALDSLRSMEHRQNLLDLAHMFGIDPLRVVILKKLPQPLMFEALDHRPRGCRRAERGLVDALSSRRQQNDTESGAVTRRGQRSAARRHLRR